MIRASTDEELRTARSGGSSKRKSTASTIISRTGLYDWINNNFSGLKRFGTLSLVGVATLATALFLRRYGPRFSLWGRR